MRVIPSQDIVETVARLCQEANYFLPEDVFRALEKARETEESPLGRETLGQILTNARLARVEEMAICQDCGVAVVFLEVGQDVHITGGELYDAVNEGVRRGYEQGYLRKSMVSPPHISRVNTRDNTPAVIHTDIIPGDRLRITVMPKGGGSENMSRLFMLSPGQGRQGVIEAVIRAVDEAGSNPCPPVIVGVGIGGTAEKAMTLAKKATLRPIGSANPVEENARLEQELLRRVNALGIGPEGFGGRITALAVHVETFPAHLASLPVAVSLQCHAARQKEAVL
ncbi:MAG: fumarate hydratase [Chloroflexi bacterium]|nr:fumarate hydratase [Chloroflexota bacterium]